MRRTILAVALGCWVGVGVAAVAGAEGGAGEGSVTGEVRVDGRALALAHAYLFHAPDPWDASKTKAVALLTVAPLDPAAVAKATTLSEVLEMAGESVKVEVGEPGAAVQLSICHDAFGPGKCYSTSVYPPEWSAGEAAQGHLAGSLKTFTGEPETVFEKFELFYDFRFDAAPARDFERRN